MHRRTYGAPAPADYLPTATVKSAPSHLPRRVHRMVNRSALPATRDCVGRSQTNVPKPVARHSLSVVVIQLSDDQCTDAGSSNSRRRIRSTAIRLILEVVRQTIGAGSGVPFT